MVRENRYRLIRATVDQANDLSNPVSPRQSFTASIVHRANRSPTMSSTIASSALTRLARKLRDDVDQLTFRDPVSHVYNPLRYAWRSHRKYLSLASPESTQVLFLGMNPGPWGMAQTGVPFGEIAAVRDWIGINEPVDSPENEHPKRPVEGFGCSRSEVSGRRLWGLFQEVFDDANAFFQEHFIANYCPLVFMESSARNRTPDKLPADERVALDKACDSHLRGLIKLMQPSHLVGVGAYAEKCIQRVLDSVDTAKLDFEPKVSRILHPSPASPAANRDWRGTAMRQLQEAGVW